MAAPLNTCTSIEQRGVVRFLWAKDMAAKECCPCTVKIACHVKQSSNATSFGGTLSCRVRVVPTATTRILRRRFPGTCETLGQVFKFVWRLCWKINVVCMSLSPFVSFQSRFVTFDFPSYLPVEMVQYSRRLSPSRIGQDGARFRYCMIHLSH